MQVNPLSALSTFDNNTQRLVIRENKLESVNRKEITGFQMFLRFFGLGKFSNVKVHLKDIAIHLNQYNFSEIKPGENIINKITNLANKAILKGYLGLVENNSISKLVDLSLQFNYQFIQSISQGFPRTWTHTDKATRPLSWNCKMTFEQFSKMISLTKFYHVPSTGDILSRVVFTRQKTSVTGLEKSEILNDCRKLDSVTIRINKYASW